MLFDKVIAFDHFKQKIILIANMALSEPETGYNKAILDLKQMRDLLKHGKPKKEYGGHLLGDVTPLFDKMCIRDRFISNGVELNPDIEVATTDQILQLVKSELGLAFLPETMSKEAISQNQIIRINLKEEIPQRHICMVYDKQHPISAAAKTLKNLIV